MTTPEAGELVGPTTELLQSLIRNECVNDGTPESGYETRNADLLQTYLEGAGLDVARFEKQEGRASIVARIEGSDPDAASLCLMGHTDVVPVNPDGWSREPFSGEVLDGEVWGRGAIDMLNITASMAVAFRRLANEGFQPKGDLIYFGVADEEAGGEWGAEFMVNEHWDAVGADYVVTELGGWSQVDGNGDRHIVINVGEKGIAWTRLRVNGTPAHGSMPFGADNALITAAEIVRRLAEFRPPARLDDIWRGQVASLDVPDNLRAALLDPATVWDTIAALPPPRPESPTPARTPRSRPTSHTAARRRTPSPTRSISTSTSASSPATPSRPPAAICRKRSATCGTASRSPSYSTPRPPGRPRATRCGTRLPPRRRPPTPAPRCNRD